MKKSTGIINEILRERERQVNEEGYNAKSDDAYVKNELIGAAIAYNMSAAGNSSLAAYCWPWGLASFKPTTQRRDLIKAAALLVAEIERLDRATGEKDLSDDERKKVTFWVVLTPSSPKLIWNTFISRISADTEAKRLARKNPDKTFFVMEMVGEYDAPTADEEQL